MTQHYSNPSRADDRLALPDVETFWRDADIDGYESGWYYWFRYPGCMPDSNPIGPFETEAAAVEDFTNDLPWNKFSK